MNRMNILAITSLLFFFSDILLILQLQKTKSLATQQQNELSQICFSKDAKINDLEEMIIQSLSSENYNINNLTLLTDDNLTISINEISVFKPLLVLRYSELSCNTCVDMQFVSLKKISQNIGRENIIILSSYKSISNLVRFKRINNLNYNFYNIDSIGLPLEKYNIPFYFIYDKEKKTKSVFIPNSDNPNLTEKYFEFIQYRYFNSPLE